MYIRSSLSRVVVLLSLVTASPVWAQVELWDPDYDHINASAIDQPRLGTVLTDGGQIIYDQGEPIIIGAFIDTGASGIVISNLQAVGYEDEWGNFVPSLGLDGLPAGEFVDVYTETGIAGSEVGDVTRAFGVRVLNGDIGIAEPALLNDFVDYGQHGLWVRRAPGMGEIVAVPYLGILADPINIIGMPVIGQRVMVIDPSPIADLGYVQTHLLPPGDPGIPRTNITFRVEMEDFSEAAPASLSQAANPMIPGVRVSNTVGDQTHDLSNERWLFDTGSGSTFITLDKAKQLGLIGPQYGSVQDFIDDGYAGYVSEVGGIGPGSVQAPILRVDKISIPTKQGFVVTWRNVDVLVLDEVAGLDGVFGMNLLIPAVTIDSISPNLDDLFDFSPGYFDRIVLDATDPTGAVLEMATDPQLIPLSADADLDGVVDLADLGILATYWGLQSDQSWWTGDFSGDGKVDLSDLGILGTYYGSTKTAAIPEPTTAVTLAVLAGLLSWRRSQVV